MYKNPRKFNELDIFFGDFVDNECDVPIFLFFKHSDKLLLHKKKKQTLHLFLNIFIFLGYNG